MTTTVLIVNKGPNIVKVEVQDRDGSGRFQAGAEFFIDPKMMEEITIHEHRSIQIIEDADLPEGAAV